MNRPPTPPEPQACPRGQQACNLTCKYNHFEADDLVIDSWELKCLDCGFRNTIAFRSDDSDLDLDSAEPTVCPFCKLGDLPTGKDPCQRCP